MAAIDKVLTQIDGNRESALKRLFEFLRIKSISTDPAYKDECARAAQWLVDELKSLGGEAEAIATEGHPAVLAHFKSGRRDTPHVLFYGHYDVQPVDPIDLWRNDPFEPKLDDNGGQILARGAADDKGQVMAFIEACRGFAETGKLPCEVTILLEGEEESGSPSLPAFMAANKKALSADLMLVCDTTMWDKKTPAITMMLRGLAVEEVKITCANRDLHSGMYGGPARNPIHVLAKIIADLHDEDGRITLKNFYQGVPELPKELVDQWRKLDFDAAEFLKDVNLSASAGEMNFTVLEQIWARPSCDVNGIVGGYTAEGSKTIIPSQASAKVSFRLVGAQKPADVIESFHDFVQERLPRDARVEFISHSASPAVQLRFEGEIMSRARRVLLEEWGAPAVMAGSGGSIPIVGAFKRELGMDALMIGFGLDDDKIHSPNEKYELTSFQKGARSWARVLDALAK